MNIILFNDIDNDHLAGVQKAMEQLGAPTIKAVWVECYDAWVALNGSHRIMAAKNLGLMPEIEEIEYSEDLTTDDLGMQNEFQDDSWTLDEIISHAARKPVIVKF